MIKATCSRLVNMISAQAGKINIVALQIVGETTGVMHVH
jgi:hypothetical protein